MSELKILDISAGNRAMWFDKGNDLVTFLDKRESVKPDFVCDTREIPEEVGENYDVIVFDPPHVNTGANSDMAKRYGHSTTAEIKDTIIRSAKEVHRISKNNALMAFKWNDKIWSLDNVLGLMEPFWEPLFGSHLRNQGGPHAKTQSFWVILLRKEINE